jgi:hypothetical protein
MADTSATIAAIERLKARLGPTVIDIVQASLDEMGRAGRRYAPIGIPGNSTAPPGELRESIVQLVPVVESGGRAYGRVGPTTIYARQRELGGPIRPVFAKNLHFSIFGREIITRAVFQHGSHYMATAYVQSNSAIRRIRDERLTAAILGS